VVPRARQGRPTLKLGDTNDRTTAGDSNYVWALRDINFEVQQGEVLGIIGKNGAGKSTLLKLLSRVTSPTIGSIKAKGRIASLLEVGTGFHPELTGRENVFLNGAIMGMKKHEIARKLDEIVDFAGVERYLETPVKRYSSGMYVRLAFAVAAHLEPEILIVDEVLAVGDAEFQKKCIEKMSDVSRNDGRTVLFVSHNLTSVRNLCERCLMLNNGQLHMSGNVSDVINGYFNLQQNNGEGAGHGVYKTNFGLDVSDLQMYGSNRIGKEVIEYLEPILSACILYNTTDRHMLISISYEISDSTGEFVTCFGNDMQSSEKIAIAPGCKRKVMFETSSVYLNPGEYHVNLFVHETHANSLTEEHDYFERIMTMRCVVNTKTDTILNYTPSGKGHGRVTTLATMTVTDVSQ
jgi:lipopolysaccharide transport system ATP-binding protein